MRHKKIGKIRITIIFLLLAVVLFGLTCFLVATSSVKRHYYLSVINKTNGDLDVMGVLGDGKPIEVSRFVAKPSHNGMLASHGHFSSGEINKVDLQVINVKGGVSQIGCRLIMPDVEIKKCLLKFYYNGAMGSNNCVCDDIQESG